MVPSFLKVLPLPICFIERCMTSYIFWVTSFVTVLMIFCKLYNIVLDFEVLAVVLIKVQVCGDTVVCCW